MCVCNYYVNDMNKILTSHIQDFSTNHMNKRRNQKNKQVLVPYLLLHKDGSKFKMLSFLCRLPSLLLLEERNLNIPDTFYFGIYMHCSAWIMYIVFA